MLRKQAGCECECRCARVCVRLCACVASCAHTCLLARVHIIGHLARSSPSLPAPPHHRQHHEARAFFTLLCTYLWAQDHVL